MRCLERPTSARPASGDLVETCCIEHARLHECDAVRHRQLQRRATYRLRHSVCRPTLAAGRWKVKQEFTSASGTATTGAATQRLSGQGRVHQHAMTVPRQRSGGARSARERGAALVLHHEEALRPPRPSPAATSAAPARLAHKNTRWRPLKRGCGALQRSCSADSDRCFGRADRPAAGRAPHARSIVAP